MQICSNESRKYSIDFINAFDEFNQINRKLFDIDDIDKFLSFSDKKNICMVTKASKSNTFLYSIITKICIDYHTVNDKNNSYNYENYSNYKNFKLEKKKTILVDAGNGNNLGYLYLDLIKKSVKNEFDVDNILEQIIIVRAFTFYQLVNIIINEIPKLLYQLNNCKIQIIVLDLFDTLLSSSSSSPTSRIKGNGKNDFKHNEKLVSEIIDTLINLSKKYFVILYYDDSNNQMDKSFISKFDNSIQIDQLAVINNRKKKEDKKTELKIIIRSKNILAAAIATNNKQLSRGRIAELSIQENLVNLSAM